MSDAIEGAIISLTMQGAEAVQRTADKVTVDLSNAKRAGDSAERSSKLAESAASEAEVATNNLQSAAISAASKVSQAGRIVDRLLGTGNVFGEVGIGARIGGQSFSLLSGLLGSLIPGGGLATTLLAGGLSAAAGIYVSTQREERDEDREERQADRIAKKVNDLGDNDLEAKMLQQVGLAKIDHAVTR